MITPEKAIEVLRIYRNHSFGDCRTGLVSVGDIIKLLTPRFGKWIEGPGGMTPGGTPYFVCDNCCGGGHLHGVEYPRRMMRCEQCGSINSYPWETIYDEGKISDE